MRIGILGGTFDPIHCGHILAAEKIKAAFSLDYMILLPAGNPTHKIAARVTPGAARVDMTRLAAEGKEGFFVWDCEVKRSGYTYTVDTLRELREILEKSYPKERAEVYYVVGTDAVGGLHKWKEAEELYKLCTFIAAKRPGEDDNVYNERVATAKASGAKIECYREDDLIEVSSTEIREAASQGKTLKGLVPEKVAEYIVKNRLYRYDEAVSIELIKADLSERLTEEKYTHSSGVAKEAARLGKLLGADEEKCYLAGLLHDCAKCLTKAQLDWMNVKLEDYCFGDPYCGVNHRVLHGFTGRILAEKRYGVSDPEVLEAVACHVTGQPEMGIIAQIVFISDFTEENREGAFFDKIRAELSERGIVAAIRLACDMTAALVIDRGEALDVNTIRTRNWAVQVLKNGGKL